MKDKTSIPFRLLLIAFAPFVFGAIMHSVTGSEIMPWVAVISVMVMLLIYIRSKLILSYDARKTFSFFSLLSFLLSIIGSVILFNLEGFKSFDEVRDFRTTLYHVSDMDAMGPLAAKLKAIAESSGFIEALSYDWTGGWYNNYVSVYKMGFALWSMPGVGYYSFTILNWWFAVVFYLLAMIVYEEFANNNIEAKHYHSAGLLAWLIVPFALPIDRELIGVLFFGVIAYATITQRKLTILSVVSVVVCCYLLPYQRTGYAVLTPIFLFIFIVWRLWGAKLHLMRRRIDIKTVTISLAIIFIIGSISYLPIVSSLFGLSDDYVQSFIRMTSNVQDLWGQFQLGIPVFDQFLKLLFLVLTPFPYWQIFRNAQDGFDLIVPERLVSLNVFPVYMLGKLYVTILLVRLYKRSQVEKSVLLLYALLLLLGVAVSIRAGHMYLVPAYSIIIIWVLANGINKSDISRNLMPMVKVTFLAHIMYIIVYWKI